MTMKKILVISTIIFSFTNVKSQCFGNLFINGSFSDTVGKAIIAPGWNGTGTPDVNDVSGLLFTTSGYTWTGTPISSANGGTWQNLFSSAESVQQTINVIPNKLYSLSFEYAAQGIHSDTIIFYDNPVGINTYIDGVLSFTTPDDTTQYTWESANYIFSTSNSVVTIKFSPTQTVQ